MDLKIERQSAPVRQRAVELLKRAILEGEVAPGQRLLERVLCERTGVSRTSIREALRQLEAEGLVVNIPGKGPMVVALTAQDAQELYEVRSELEGLAGRLCAERGTPQHLDIMGRCLAQMRQAAAVDSLREFLAIKDDFYEVMLDAAGNGALRAFVHQMWTRLTVMRSFTLSKPGRMTQSLGEIEAIFAALAAEDAEATARACAAHVKSAAEAASFMMSRNQAQLAGTADPVG